MTVGPQIEPKPLRLDDDEQLTQLGVALRTMTLDIERLPPKSERYQVRLGRINRLRFQASGGHDPLPIEDAHVLAMRLEAVRTPAHEVQMLVTAAAHQPWVEHAGDLGDHAGRLDRKVRREVLDWMCTHFTLEADHHLLDHLDRLLRTSVGAKARLGAKSLLTPKGAALVVGGVAVGVATAGLAAPAIGAALAPGLSGAAASAAGLATLGGGSIAAGGLGMAGGTMVVGALGAAGGGGLVALGSTIDGARALNGQVAMLRALIGTAYRVGAQTKSAADEQVALVEIDVLRHLEASTLNRLAGDRDASAKHMAEASASLALRQALPAPRWRLP